VFVFAAQTELGRQRSVLRSQSVWIVVLFALLVYGPGCMTVLAHSPDWAVSYVFPPSFLRTLFTQSLSLLNLVAPVVGFILSNPRPGQSLSSRSTRLIGVACTVLALGIASALPRLSVVGTYHEYHQNFGTQRLGSSIVGYGLLVFAVLLSATAIWTHFLLKSIGTRTEPPSRRTGYSA
jgi:hypothetical protein